MSKVKQRREIAVSEPKRSAAPAGTPRRRGAVVESRIDSRDEPGRGKPGGRSASGNRTVTAAPARPVKVKGRPTAAAAKVAPARPGGAKGPGDGSGARAATSKAGRRPAGRKVVGKAAAPRQGKGHRAPVEPERVIRIKELDPYAKCGPGTSVVQLFRVDERLDGASATHLVFFDRHGWYCEHGRHCPAVEDVRKLGKSLVRTI